ncbi:hypothetical protein BDQ94DRAFT_133105 [Aspergillus welwitschiae]|uniref:Uncharacterized protein n=1 Tax=Aspergillus welwitschiae TaxID=1341132 RepID=A0A3F3QKE9_9EURO|nr:hypothetical protein BDQ94DRAFT_133105 [Aspergillus welwitschiae]RDH39459.1 hypothetical protein BDQ94DRAFT_133105 [Aspergillus welwitschiae]
MTIYKLMAFTTLCLLVPVQQQQPLLAAPHKRRVLGCHASPLTSQPVFQLWCFVCVFTFGVVSFPPFSISLPWVTDPIIQSWVTRSAMGSRMD